MITKEQRRERQKHIGSSDAPAIIGVDPWRNPADVYYSKISDSDDVTTDAMQTGNRMETPLLDMAVERYGNVIRNFAVIDREYPELAANLDGLLEGSPEGIEAKYVGPKSAEYWGAQETDEVPDHVAIQCQFQMRVANLQRVHVPAAIIRPYVGLSWEWFHIERDEELIDDLTTACLGFWRRHVETRTPPGNVSPSPEMLRKIRRVPGSVIDLTADAVASLRVRKDWAETKKNAEAGYERATAEILAMLGAHEAGRLPDGSILIYAEENAGKKLIDPDSTFVAHPELFHQTSRRVLRLRKGEK